MIVRELLDYQKMSKMKNKKLKIKEERAKLIALTIMCFSQDYNKFNCYNYINTSININCVEDAAIAL